MNKLNLIAVDLAKNVFQICVLSKTDKVMSNRELPAKRFGAYLAKQPHSLVAFEACGRAQHWARKSREYGHEVVILPPRIVASFRQGHKTDGNDALAVGLTARQPAIKPAGIKNLVQQSLQSDLRVHKHVSDQLTATGNMLRGLLAEFGIEIPRGIAALKKNMPWIFEDAENGLPLSVRESLFQAWALWKTQDEYLQTLEKLLCRRLQEHEPCQQLSKLEGVGVKNALGLYVELGDASHFKNGRNAAACIGVTPKQHSSGGKVKLGSIGKYSGNQRLRSSLILGAHAVINKLDKREAKTEKEHWLKALIIRRGKGRAAVALANKTVRTAWAMLYHNEPYKASLELAV
jgi:transposase